MSNVLIIDDEQPIGWSLARLARDEGHQPQTASSAEQALALAARHPFDLVFLDVRLPGADGLSIMPELMRVASRPRVVVMTAFGDLECAVCAYRHGAFDYLAKPFDLQTATAVMRRALAATGELREDPEPAQPAADQSLVGRSPAIQEVFKRIALVAPTEATVIISGESGTGKELVARAIHRHSRRSTGAFVPIHLAALSPALIESELFGHRRGAYTGADDSRPGLLEKANGGTVFLDEVGEVPLEAQTKLLRAIEQQEVMPVGETEVRQTDFRLLAATNRDLRREMAAGRFREDLYYRLAMFEIVLPPLRERAADIELLAEHFLAGCAREGRLRFSPAARAALTRFAWPGNVRQLRNVVRRAALVARDGEIDVDHLNLAEADNCEDQACENLALAVAAWTRRQLQSEAAPKNLYDELLRRVERPFLDLVLEKTGYNRSAAADLLGIHRATLRKKLGERPEAAG